MAIEIAVRPGWYVTLRGHDADLSEWSYELKPPFDPHICKLSEKEIGLWGDDFQKASGPSEVRELASAILRRLNGALKLSVRTEPVTIDAVVRCHEDGTQSRNHFLKAEGAVMRGYSSRPTLIVYDADGNVIPPPPPNPSEAQRWSNFARNNDTAADMLDHYGRADNWYDIYKTVELAERLVGGAHKLKKLQGSRAIDVTRLKRSANYYRHAALPIPEDMLTTREASAILADTVRAVLRIGIRAGSERGATHPPT